MGLIELTEDDKKLLEQFEEYDGTPKHYVGSRDYWASIFTMEKNRDPELHKAFSDLHAKIVDDIIAFCREHNLNVDEANIHVNGILGSREYGEWTASTDSSMYMYDVKTDDDGWVYPDREHPFLFQV